MSDQTVSPERKYALSKGRGAGDWLLPSNDGTRIYRLMKYTEGSKNSLPPPSQRGRKATMAVERNRYRLEDPPGGGREQLHPRPDGEWVPYAVARVLSEDLARADKALDLAFSKLQFVGDYDGMEAVGRLRRGASEGQERE